MLYAHPLRAAAAAMAAAGTRWLIRRRIAIKQTDREHHREGAQSASALAHAHAAAAATLAREIRALEAELAIRELQ